jgi:hypothetical protein
MKFSPTYDRYGYDAEGRSSYGYDRDGYFVNGWHLNNGTHRNGTAVDDHGFGHDGLHKDTGTRLGPDGRTAYAKAYETLHPGYDSSGRDAEGFDLNGFDVDELHRETRTRYGLDGYDCEGQDRDGFDRAGFYFDLVAGEERSPAYESARHRETKSRFGPDGYDCEGLDENSQDSVGNEWTEAWSGGEKGQQMRPELRHVVRYVDPFGGRESNRFRSIRILDCPRTGV